MKNLTRSLTMLAVVLVLIVSATVTLALPKIDIYRYQSENIRTLPGGLVIGEVTTVDSWIKDEARWPKDKKILLLVHGLPMLDNGRNRYGLVGLANHFAQERKIDNDTLPAYDVIYSVEYPMGFSVFETTQSLFQIISDKTADFSQTQKYDIFAHSLGGLPVRGDLEFSGDNKVGHVVFMGTPHNGVNADELSFFREKFDFLPVEINDLNPEGMFLTILNSDSMHKDAKNFNYDWYSIVGTRSWAPEQFGKNFGGLFGGSLSKVLKKIQDKNYAVHDGLIGSESAGYDLSKFCRSFKLITLDLNHEYVKSDPTVFSAIDKWMTDDKWFPTSVVVVPQAQTYTGGLPFMLGKSRADTVAVFGNNGLRDTLYSDKANNIENTSEWIYTKVDIEDYTVRANISFVPYLLRSDGKIPRDDIKNDVQMVGYNNIMKYNLGRMSNVSVREVVPKEILESAPSDICWSSDGNYLKDYSLVVMWKYFGDTFVLNVQDDRYSFVDLVQMNCGPRNSPGTRVKKNANAANFADANHVISFSQIKGDVNLFGKEISYNYWPCFRDAAIPVANCAHIRTDAFFRYFFYRFQ